MDSQQIQPGATQVLIPLSGVAPLPRVPSQATPDAFAGTAGPDADVVIDAQATRVFAHFQLDPETKEMKVSVVDEAGRVIRLIPAESVRQMIAAMASYHGR
jgi:hypothetical protein